MKIIHISITNNIVPPQGYGGVERIVHWLAEAQIQRGHEVYVVAPEGGQSKATNIPIPLWGSEEEAYEKSYRTILDIQPDVIHDHTFSQIFRLRHPNIPEVSTHHNERFEPVNNTVYPSLADATDNGSTVFVHHGLDPKEYEFNEEKEDYLLYLGAIHPRKNVDLAIKIAKSAKMPLKIAGPVRHPGYFCKKIRKRLTPEITYHGEALGPIKNHLLKKAKALLYLSSWESFGIAVIEAMVSGTPVIVSDIPPFHETVQNGVTGFICKNKKEYLHALENSASLKPKDCRDWVLKQFTNSQMSEGYEELYLKAVNGENW